MNKTSSQSEHPSRHRRSRAEVAELVAAFERSGLNRTEYCRQHGLSLSSLKRYSKRMGKGRGWSDQSECTAPAVSLYPFGQGHTFAGVNCVIDWMHDQDIIPVRAS